jgi:hypothetical protein
MNIAKNEWLDTPKQVADWNVQVDAFCKALDECKTPQDLYNLLDEHEDVANYVTWAPSELEHLGIGVPSGATELSVGYGELCTDNGYTWDGCNNTWFENGCE